MDILTAMLGATALLAGGLVFYGWRSSRPGDFNDPPRDVLICAAHSDDCVIAGAEYAWGALKDGLSVRIAYLTCSGPAPDADIARVRKAEAIAAWSAIGVSADALTFIDLRESPIEGPQDYTAKDLERAGADLETLMRALPQNAAVIIPAAGEDHIDHRNLRDAALAAISRIGRSDLSVYETPEYNAHLSLVLSPERTVRTMARYMPGLNRLVKPYRGAASFIDGSPGRVFRDAAERLEKKKELLTYFKSQDAGMVAGAFGYPTLYRKMPRPDAAHTPGKTFQLFGCECDASVLALWLLTLTGVFLAAFLGAKTLTLIVSGLPVASVLAVMGVIAAIFYIVRTMRGAAPVEVTSYTVAVALGLAASAL